jgi:hypothetical protein
VRHNNQGEALWPSVGSDGRQRQRAGARDHATDREPGNAFFELGRQRAEVWEWVFRHVGTDPTVLSFEL